MNSLAKIIPVINFYDMTSHGFVLSFCVVSVLLVEGIVDSGDLVVEEQQVFDLPETWGQILYLIEEWRIKDWKGANRWISLSIHLESYPRSSKSLIFTVCFSLFKPIKEKGGGVGGVPRLVVLKVHFEWIPNFSWNWSGKDCNNINFFGISFSNKPISHVLD